MLRSQPQTSPPPGARTAQSMVQVDREALAVLREQKVALQHQIDLLDAGSPLRGSLSRDMLALDRDIVHQQVAIAAGEARLGVNQATPEIGQPPMLPPPPGGQPWIDPVVLSALVSFITVAIILPISVGITRRMWRRVPKDTTPHTLDKVLPRLDRIEQAVDAIAIEVERISEGQRFVTKALAERPVQVNAAAPHAVNDASGLGDAKPFLALGAGPIEPIRVAERQVVRQSITPH